MAFQAKKLINHPNNVVMEYIEGLVRTYRGLKYLDGFPEVKVVLRGDLSSKMHDKVAVVSGGGSGHEPAQAGYVGEGMLTAAICGDFFTSPPVDSILAAIRAVTGPMGCLLIVMNYPGDRLNFGLAAEQAKSEGYKVETVIVGDDCALPPRRGIIGRRGLAGTILVNKVAGAAAGAGLSLADVAAEAKCASEVMGTMGVALSVCTLPGQVTSDRLGPEKMEVGVGIHGEPGAAVADLQQVNAIITRVLNQILSTETGYVPITRGDRVVLMVNGLGATTAMKIVIAAGQAVPKLQLEHGLAVDRAYAGCFMSSLDMAGFSITIMKSDESILQRLDAATKAPYWPVAVDGQYFAANRPPAIIAMPSTKSEEPWDMEDEDEEFENWEIRENFLLDLPPLAEDAMTTPADQHKELEDWGEGFSLPLDFPPSREDEADQIEQLPVMQEPEAEEPPAMGDLLVAYAEFVSKSVGIPYLHRLKRFFELAILNLGTRELARLSSNMHGLYRDSLHSHVAQEPLGNELIERAEFVSNGMGTDRKLSYLAMLWQFLLLSSANLEVPEMREMCRCLRARFRWRIMDERENQRNI